MTAPEAHGPEVPDEESLVFEALAVARVTAAMAETLDKLVNGMLAIFELALHAGPITPEAARALGETFAQRISSVDIRDMEPALRQVASEARDLGQERAIQRFIDQEMRVRAAALADWRSRGEPELPDIDGALREGLREAAQIARAGVRNRRQVTAVAGKVRAARHRAQGTARFVANEGINAGTAEVARAMELRLLWVTERNGCLACLAHAGWAVSVGKLFPRGLSFDPVGTRFAPVKHPPLHPNCRCQVRTYEGPAGPPPGDRSSIDPAARLAAEARRSVVYQWTDHASGPAARRAAEALLSAGAGLPSSVEKRARVALRRGNTVPRPR